jgi:transporter family-2 protein
MSPASLFLFAALLGSGVCVALQGPTNALLAHSVNSPINAAFLSFFVGTLVLGVVIAFQRVQPNWQAMFHLPWYAWMGGAYGAVFVSVVAFAAPRIGIAQTLTLLIAGQAATALVLDHFGAFGLVVRPINLTRVLGMAAVVVGVLLVRRT